MGVSPNLQAAAFLIAIELAVVAVLSAVSLTLVAWISRRASATENALLRTSSQLAAAWLRQWLGVGSLCGAVLIVSYNAWMATRGIDARAHTIGLLQSLAADNGRSIGIVLGAIVVLLIAAAIAIRILCRIMDGVAYLVDRWGRLADDKKILAGIFAALKRIIATLGWLIAALLACRILRVPESLVDGLIVVMRVYLVIAVGLVLIRSTEVVLKAADRIVEGHARDREWSRYYEELHSLLPTLRTCLDYALLVGVVSLAVYQIGWFQRIAAWGPLFMEGLAIFFAGQVVIQLGYLEIGHRMLSGEGLEESERRRRATMVPLVRSTFMCAAYFITAVLILGALGFNPMPFLAGAGIIGLVVGFGAQSMINDVVSGFFILFENIYLVGDIIEAGSARGVVEAIEFRTTKIRDVDGRLHIVRNGDMKLVVNYSKDYAVAVVALDVGYDADLRTVFNYLRQAGAQLRAESDAILGDTEIDGITAFGPSSMTIRTSTRVKPGYHDAVAAALRLVIKETFDPHATETSRKTLIPERWSPDARASLSYAISDPSSPRSGF